MHAKATFLVFTSLTLMNNADNKNEQYSSIIQHEWPHFEYFWFTILFACGVRIWFRVPRETEFFF